MIGVHSIKLKVVSANTSIGYMMMRIYIAAKFENIFNANKLAKVLTSMNHMVTSSWCLGTPETLVALVTAESKLDFTGLRGAAEKDIYELKMSDTIVLLSDDFTPDERLGHIKMTNSHGRYVEFGYAIAGGLKCYVVGKHESIFHYLNSVTVLPTVYDFISTLED